MRVKDNGPSIRKQSGGITGRGFKPGQSGNPGGRPKVPKEIVEACRAYTEEAIQTLVDCLRSKNPQVRIRAAEVILNRAWGKPQQPVELSGGLSLEELLAASYKAKSEGLGASQMLTSA